MSHFTTVKTTLNDVTLLKQAIKRLEWTFTEAEAGAKVQVKGWEDHTLEADLEIKCGCLYGIGVNVQADGSCVLDADWWAIETYTGFTQESLIEKLTHEYAYVTVMDKVHSLGYDVVEESASADNQLRIVVRRWQ
jgi:hypothetical protein